MYPNPTQYERRTTILIKIIMKSIEANVWYTTPAYATVLIFS